MDVGNDPFPREEVTGLAAFENLEPVSSLDVIPETEPPPVSSFRSSRGASVPPPVPAELRAGAARTAPFGQTEAPTQGETRGDPTLPLDLSVEAAGSIDGAGSVDKLFDDSPGWDDPDEATRVVTPALGAAAAASLGAAAGQSANLDMDWDEDEPPTRMRTDAMFSLPPVEGASRWDDATPTGEHEDPDSTATFPSHHASTTISGGRPSPFPPAPVAAESGFRAGDVVARSKGLGEPSPFSTTATGIEGWADSIRSGDRRTLVKAGGAVAGLILVAVLLRSLFGGASTGTVTLVTTPADAHVSIDGRPMAGTASPYSLSGITAGKHDVVVQKQGFVDYHGSFTLSRAENLTLPVVELVPSVRDVGFSIRSAPPGAEVWLDDHATDQLTPARITGLTSGIHRLQLKRAGYADFELQMFIPDATVLQLPPAELSPLSEATAAPVTPEKPAKAHSSSASDDGTPKLSWSERRKAKLAARAAAGGGTTTPSAPRTSSAFSSARKPAAPMMAAAPAAPAMAAGGKTGLFRVNSRPWAQVIIDGRLVGNTPQAGLALPPGNHKVQLVNPAMGLSKNFSISIKAGQTVTKVMNLAE